MSRLLSTLPLIALLALGTAPSAQETATDDTATTTEDAAGTGAAEETAAEDAGADTATELDMGEETTADPSYIKDQYGDWQLQCFRSEAEEDPCQMYQLLRESAGNPVAEFSLFKLPDGSQAAAGATIVVPLGTLLNEGLKIAVDGGKAKNFQYSFCSMVGCFARIGFTQSDIDAFKKGSAAKLVIVPAQAPDQTVEIAVSLDGFTAAFSNSSVAPN